MLGAITTSSPYQGTSGGHPQGGPSATWDFPCSLIPFLLIASTDNAGYNVVVFCYPQMASCTCYKCECSPAVSAWSLGATTIRCGVHEGLSPGSPQSTVLTASCSCTSQPQGQHVQSPKTVTNGCRLAEPGTGYLPLGEGPAVPRVCYNPADTPDTALCSFP